ncbi:MAG: T9SS type A sorting domain-containing protein, partial [Flavisolibacter sp.]
TGVHEVGHYLGLRHIWGDTYCGDDMVGDTPTQGNFTSGCPSGIRRSCNNGSSGDMYMNYMDFTNDPCMNLFTHGQKDRMLSLFKSGGPRSTLLTSKGLSQPWNNEPVTEIPVPSMKFKYFPNPAVTEMTINVDYNTTWIGKTISIVNLNGIILSTVKITSSSQKINLSSLKPGMYFIQGDNFGQRIREKFVKM